MRVTFTYSLVPTTLLLYTWSPICASTLLNRGKRKPTFV